MRADSTTPEPRRTDHLGAIRRTAVAFALVGAVAVGAAVAAASTSSSLGRVFYLDLRPGQCGEGKVSNKTLLVVPCSNAQHNLEVYARVHGGWPGAQVPPRNTAYAIAQRLCINEFSRRFGHRIGRGYGWYAFWPDAGKEAAKYHDLIVCSLIRWPGEPPMGPGTHFRAGAA